MHALFFGLACMAIGALLFKGTAMLLEEEPAAPPLAGFGPTPPDLSVPPTLARAQLTLPRSELRADDVAIVVGAQRRLVKDRCFANRLELQSEHVELALVVAANGNVVSASGDGHDPQLSSCVATQAMGWRFPLHDGETHLALPFTFVRE